MAVKRTFGSSFIKEKKALHKFKVKYEQESEWLKDKTLLDAKRKRRVPDTLKQGYLVKAVCCSYSKLSTAKTMRNCFFR